MRVALACAAVAALVAAPALGDGKDEARVRKVTADYATCVVRKHHDRASEAVLSLASNGTIIHRMTQIIDPDCLAAAVGPGVDMRFPNDTYQYALADALVRADYADRGPDSFEDRLPLAQPASVPPDEEAREIAKARNERACDAVRKEIAQRNALAWMARYGECVARQDPAAVRYWLLTPPETPEETSRIKALQPAFGACLRDGTMRFNRIVIRGAVAIAYYRLAKATVVPAAKSAA